MILYHGSNLVVEKPFLVRQVRGLDFGKGFYTTEFKKQAISFAGRVFDRRKIGTPTVSVYEFDKETAFKDCSLISFETADEAWLDFVHNHRNLQYNGKDYELSYGPVANDDIYETFQLYEDGILSKDDTIKRLQVKRLYNQLVLSSERALTFLKFIGTLDEKGELING
jgi:hypothetical protein